MSDPHVLRDGDLPTPFTAEEIRLATPPGLAIEGRTTFLDGSESRWRRVYVEVDEQGAVSELVPLDPAGTAAAEPEERTASTWLELQAHASFPRDAASVRRERVTTPLGTLDCTRYDVARGERTMVFWFADAHPGMPIRFGMPVGDGWGNLTEVLRITVPA